MSKTAHTLSVAITGAIGDIVYQRVRKGRGNIETDGHHDLQIRVKGGFTDARTTAQLQGRARIAAATAAYKALTPAERETWRLAAKGIRGTGYNLFVRDFCQTHPLSDLPPIPDGGNPAIQPLADLDGGSPNIEPTTTLDGGAP